MELPQVPQIPPSQLIWGTWLSLSLLYVAHHSLLLRRLLSINEKCFTVDCRFSHFLHSGWEEFVTYSCVSVYYDWWSLRKITLSDARNSQQLFRVKKNNTTLCQGKTSEQECHNITATYCYIFSTWNNCYEFLLSDGVIL